MNTQAKRASDKVVLVTGGAGYIGSHTCKALSAAGYSPIVVDNLAFGHAWAVKWGPMEVGDLLDGDFLDRIVRRYEPIAAMHFAAFAYVGESVVDPRKYYRNNVGGSLRLLETLLDHGVHHTVFSSSCTTYGMPERLPIGESHPQNPISPYGASKLMVERMLQDFGAAYGSRHVALRYFNAAGADPDGEIGESHDPETHLLPLVIETALGRRPALQVFGSDYPTPDGTAVRDYVHVTDLAAAHVKALDYLLSGGASTSLNLGTGRGYSVDEVIASVEQQSGRDVPVSRVDRRAGDPPALVADSTRAEAVLQWSPAYSELSEITRSALRWHESGPPTAGSRATELDGGGVGARTQERPTATGA